jgi:hypothetical protein
LIDQNQFSSNRVILVYIEVVACVATVLSANGLMSFIRFKLCWVVDTCTAIMFLIGFGTTAKFILGSICGIGVFRWEAVGMVSPCGRIMTSEMLCFLSSLAWSIKAGILLLYQ